MKAHVVRRKMLRRFFPELVDDWLQGGISLRVTHAGLEANACVKAFDLVLGDLQRQIHIAIAPGEARAGYTDDGVVLAHELHGFSQNRGIGVEVSLPELVA